MSDIVSAINDVVFYGFDPNKNYHFSFDELAEFKQIAIETAREHFELRGFGVWVEHIQFNYQGFYVSFKKLNARFAQLPDMPHDKFTLVSVSPIPILKA